MLSFSSEKAFDFLASQQFGVTKHTIPEFPYVFNS
jgi:hypothetical protein